MANAAASPANDARPAPRDADPPKTDHRFRGKWELIIDQTVAPRRLRLSDVAQGTEDVDVSVGDSKVVRGRLFWPWRLQVLHPSSAENKWEVSWLRLAGAEDGDVAIEVEDDVTPGVGKAFQSARLRARRVRSVVPWSSIRAQANPALYQVIVGCGGGLLLGIFLTLVFYGSDLAQKLGGLGGGTLIGGIVWFLIRHMPPVAESDVNRAKRFTYSLGFGTLLVTFLLAVVLDKTLVTLPLDPPTTRRVEQLERDIRLLQERPVHQELATTPGTRSSWMVPARPGQNHQLQVELFGPPDESADVEVVATDDRSVLLGGRRAVVHDEPLELFVYSDSWRFNVGVVWRQKSAPGSRRPRPMTPSTSRATIRLTSVGIPSGSAAAPEEVPEMALRGREYRATGELRAGADTFGGSCGGAGSPELWFRLAPRQPAWLVLEGAAGLPTVLYLARPIEGGIAEVACADSRPEPGQPTVFISRMEAAVTPGTYYLIIDGVPRVGLQTGERFELSATLEALAAETAEAVELAPTTSTVVPVDLLGACVVSGCDDPAATSVTVRVRAVEAGRYRVTDELARIAVGDADRDAVPGQRAGWRDVRSVIAATWSTSVPASAIASLAAGQEAVIRVQPVSGGRMPPTGRLVIERVPTPLEACRRASDLPRGVEVEEETNRTQSPDVFSQAVCAARGSSTMDAEGGEGAPEWIGRLHVDAEDDYVIDVRSRLEERRLGRFDDFVLYLLNADCTTAVGCNDDRDPVAITDPLLAVRLNPGDYYVVVDGYTSWDRGPFSITWQSQSELNQRGDAGPASAP
ncbi:MAG: hypothetical protein IT379_30385 [Deltaproteobacteria bacterium]|nr:hypothetical protein [Deltaproteobacteria bacterium]